jgi:hypothetical protein
MWLLCAANVTRIRLYENDGIPHFKPSVASGAALRIHACISRNFLRATPGAASMDSLTLVALAFFAVISSRFYRLCSAAPTLFHSGWLPVVGRKPLPPKIDAHGLTNSYFVIPYL